MQDITLTNGSGGTSSGTGRVGGGGLGCTGPNSSVELTRTTITANTGTYGAGLFTWSCSLVLIDSVVSDNVASSSGGAIFVENSDVDLINTAVMNNSATLYSGGALYGTRGASSNHSTDFYLDAATVLSGNTATNGSAVYINNGAMGTCDGATVQDNTATGSSGAVHVAATSAWDNIGCVYSANTPHDIHTATGGAFDTAGAPTDTYCTAAGCN